MAEQPPQDSVCITRRSLVSIVIRAETEATQSSIGMMQNLVFTQCHSSEKHTLPFQRSAFIWATFLVSRYYYDNTLSLFSTPTSFSGEVKASWTVSQQHLLKVSYCVEPCIKSLSDTSQPGLHHTPDVPLWLASSAPTHSPAQGCTLACLILTHQFLFASIYLGM